MNRTLNKAVLTKSPENYVKIRRSGKTTNTIMVIVILLLVVFAVMAALNVYGIGDGFSLSDIAGIATGTQQSIDKQRKENEEEKSKLAALSTNLSAREDELNQKEQELQQKEADLDELKNQLQLQITDVQDLTKLYEKMAPSKAASIMLRYPDEEVVASVIKNMGSAKASEILSAMEPSKAAQLLYRLSQ